MLNDMNVDLFFITEHWIFNDETFPQLNNFQVVSSFNRSNQKHGGAAILSSCKYSLNNRLDISNLSLEGSIEMACAEYVQTNKRKMILICIYRPPLGDFSEFLNIFENVLYNILLEGSNDILIGGDLNIDILKTHDFKTSALKHLLNSFNLRLTINTPTRVSQTTETCLDNFITNITYQNSCTIDTHISDHKGILIKIKTIKVESPPKSIKKRIINEKNISTLNENLLLLNWSVILGKCKNSEEYFNTFYKYFINIYNHSCPIKTIVINNFKAKTPWYTNSLREMKANIEFCYQLYQSNKSIEIKTKYKNLKNNIMQYKKQNKIIIH